MRVLIINYEFPPIGAGGGKASSSIARQLVRMGHIVRVITARPIQVYGLIGTLMAMAGLMLGAYLAYQELTVNIDIGGEGLTQVAVLLFLSGLILRVMGTTWQLFVPFQGVAGREFVDGVEVRRVPALRSRVDSCSMLEMFSFMISGTLFGLRHAASFRPDIVHVFFGIPCGPIGWLIKRVQRSPYIISLRGADVPSDEVKRFRRVYPLLGPFIRALWRDADALVAVSNGLREIALQTHELPIQVITNAVDLTQFVPRNRWGESAVCETTSVTRLIFVGRLIGFKNLETVIEALRLMKQQTHTPFAFDVVGDGVLRLPLEQQVVEAGLASSVRFHSWVDRSRVLQYYQNADVFVTASTWEGMPNTVLEAMACGLPIVATDVSGSQDLVQNGKNGCLVPVGDPQALAAAIQFLVDNPLERRRMGDQSRRIVAQYFSWEHIAAEYAEVYQRVLSGEDQADSAIRTRARAE